MTSTMSRMCYDDDDLPYCFCVVDLVLDYEVYIYHVFLCFLFVNMPCSLNVLVCTCMCLFERAHS